MKRLVFIICIGIVIAILTGCNHRKMQSQLDAISKMADINPDSALSVLSKYESEKDGWAKGDRMHFELVKMKAQNKLGVKVKSDSILCDIVSFFDCNGTPNEQMLAYYLLGRFYTNIGESPQAIQTYYDAIGKADTVDLTCDYGTLAAIYGQMANIFHQQNLPYDEIWAFNHYGDCIKRLGDEVEYIVAKSQLMRPFYLLGEKDTVLQIIDVSYNQLKKLGEPQRAAGLLPSSIYIYVERGELSQAKQIISIFENESGLFDENGNIVRGREHYYVTKGFYELAVNNYDLAEVLFRKSINAGYISDGYKGLLSVYRYKNVVDSIIRFSILYENAQDSLHNKMQIDVTHRMSALYNYNRSQKVAEEEAYKARKARLWIVCILVVCILCLVVISLIYKESKKKKQKEIHELTMALNFAKKEHKNIQEELKQLKDKDYKKLIAEKEIKEKELKQKIEKLANAAGLSPVIDNIINFNNSIIAEVFRKKKDFRSDNPIPNKAEWRALEIQFSKDMPSTYKILTMDKKLSPLEFHVCILLILDFKENEIVNLTDSMPQTITTAKSRANKKIFDVKGALTLKSELLRLIKT